MEENNKLIAEFIGQSYTSNSFKLKSLPRVEDLQYHRSWDWLMPVVDKIENMEDFRFNITIEQGFCTVIENHTSIDIVEADGNTKIEAVYNVVVEFVKWYNTTHVKTKPSV